MLKLVLSGFVLIVLTASAAAHNTEKHEKKAAFVPANLDPVETDFGKTGNPKKVSRTIRISMKDTFRFSPDTIRVKQDQTIRFLVKNNGTILHEMVIGKHEDLTKHAKLMQRFPNMEHEDPYMAHAKRNQTAEIVWQFTRPGTFEFGCLVPGHFEAGMKGMIIVEPNT